MNADTQDEPINLNAEDRTVKQLRIAAGWDLKEFDGENIDVDLSCFVLDKDDKTREDSDFVFYNNLKSADLSVRHLGDNRTGFGERDDEAIIIDLSALSFEIYKIVFVVSIYMADERDQTFKQVDNAFVRVVNEETEAELARDDINEKYNDATAVKFCEIERIGTDWHFKKIHEPTSKGLKKIAEDYDLLIASIG
jgi:tellurium resistance protein TerD